MINRESIAFSVGRRGGAHRDCLAVQRGALAVERRSTMSVTVVDANSMNVGLRREESLYLLRKAVGNGFGDVVAGASEWFGYRPRLTKWHAILILADKGLRVARKAIAVRE
ncbi:uncharacterized protein CCOS01_02707 [Colletotrichum costaricense]|uniref:Uncharacterized protein n=1 Tax=Colletotrichum costaricense TaxID=1209916 RepID=A0AAI9Z843_9PEZI|nr:uncharacterized protein CCOS01_02707 [Colletotrichum costaricense]KAK1537387.1 hypothetical protein CCOS01_02707 [Colletotrichum costaricense]